MWNWDIIIALLVIAVICIYVVEPAISLLLFKATYPNGALVAPPASVATPVYTEKSASYEVASDPVVHSAPKHVDHSGNSGISGHVHPEPLGAGSHIEHTESHSESHSVGGVPTLVFGVAAPDKEAAARASNYRAPVVRDVVSSSRPTRLYGNSNSAYGTLLAMKNEDFDDMHRFSGPSPTFIFHSSTAREDALEAHAVKA